VNDAAALGPAMPAPALRPMAPLALRAFTASTAAGVGLVALLDAVRAQRSGLRPNTASADCAQPLAASVGRIDALDARPAVFADDPALAAWDCRATRLALLGLHTDGFAAATAAAVQRHGAARVGLVLGTSASTIAASEQAYRHPAPDGGFPPALQLRALHSPHAVTLFCAQQLGIGGPAVTVSTACSSSARAFGQAERWLRLGLVDAVVVGGVDALCDSVLYGFHALGLVARGPCRPFDAARCGISVGEAAGFALLERDDPARPAALQLLGYGEANDAHHMSAPHPEGLGAEQSLDQALARAGLQAQDLQHLNLHGTGTPQNDAVEAALVARRYAATVHASATKGLTGHTMGAAGIVEAVLCLLALEHGWCPGSAQVQAADAAFGPRFASQLQLQPLLRRPQLAASHSFGFGGNNGVLLFGSAGAA
jgi:3-oxoacyl-[acyl-carrier-protein] synthase-1